ncbi:hypothetical protein M407DRAFT_242121 [Tulasnella calospora MUT 4182]|uniref:Uncharacterized protein n=1 Tax=Tulasnella calospora MUT 4182 TaxID=1051891 RepID=A0A0C3QS64_9AGAM|nr:hypothetical protein M407DRAFT_242121 [Tulasnella calospora MUT 4182]
MHYRCRKFTFDIGGFLIRDRGSDIRAVYDAAVRVSFCPLTLLVSCRASLEMPGRALCVWQFRAPAWEESIPSGGNSSQG